MSDLLQAERRWTTSAISRLSLGGSARKSRRHSRRRSARLNSAKTARRSDTWLVPTSAFAAVLGPNSGAARRRPGAVLVETAGARRPSLPTEIGSRIVSSAAGLPLALDRIQSRSRRRGRGRPSYGHSRRAPAGCRSRGGEGRSARPVPYAAANPVAAISSSNFAP